MSSKMAASSAAIRRTSSLPPLDQRAGFVDRLSNRLRARGIELVGAEFGREAAQGVWMLTLQLPNSHILTVRAPLEKADADDPFAPAVSDSIAARVLRHLGAPR